MNRIRTTGYVGIVLVLLCPVVPAQEVDAWQWPAIGPFQSSPSSVFNGFAFRIVSQGVAGSDGEVFRTVAPGTVVFRSAPARHESVNTSALPRTVETHLVAHENNFYSAYAFPEYSDDADHSWFEFVLWDGMTARQVNPRALLSRPEAAGGTALPALVYFQNGRRVAAGELTAGVVSIGIEIDQVDRTRLPWKIRVFQNDRIRGSHRLVFLEQARAPDSVDGEGRMELVRLHAGPGVHTVIVEAQRFDRTIQRRTVRFTIPEDPSFSP